MIARQEHSCLRVNRDILSCKQSILKLLMKNEGPRMTLKRVTKLWKLNHSDEITFQQYIKEITAMLQAGKVVAFPTETVYGLGADATNEQAVKQIFQAKGRPSDNPLIAHVGDRGQVNDYVTEIPSHAKKLMDEFWPGPLTIILPSNGQLAKNVTAGLSTVGMRMPDHPHALAILQAVDRPIAAPSANRSGKPSPTTAEHVWLDLNGRIDGIVDSGKTGVGVESTVIDCSIGPPMILRPGGVTREEIEAIIGPVAIAKSELEKNEAPRSPGMKYKHYAPDAPVWMVKGDAEKMRRLAEQLQADGLKVQFLISKERAQELELEDAIVIGSRHDLNEITMNLYDSLRKVDTLKVDLVLAESFSNKGIGEALMNRLERAADKIIDE
ncbi:L-threonylcarbamoyladenylate synthase [Bacillaceae bacterium W0354]